MGGLEVVPLPEKGILGKPCFNTFIPDITQNVDDTFEEYDSGSDDEELRLWRVEEVERYLDETANDFEFTSPKHHLHLLALCTPPSGLKNTTFQTSSPHCQQSQHNSDQD